MRKTRGEMRHEREIEERERREQIYIELERYSLKSRERLDRRTERRKKDKDRRTNK